MSKYLDYAGLSTYDSNIKDYISQRVDNFVAHAGVGSTTGSLVSVTASTQNNPEKWTHIDNGFTTHFRDFLIPFSYCDTARRMTTVFENRFSIDACTATDIRFYNMLSSTGTVRATDLSGGSFEPLKNYADMWVPAEYIRNASGTLQSFTPTILLRQTKYNSNLSVLLMRGVKSGNTITDLDVDVRVRNNGDLFCAIQPSEEFLTDTSWNVFALGVIAYTTSDVGYKAEFDLTSTVSEAWIRAQIASA